MKVLAWFAIAFLAFLVITGPAFWGTIQENSQQSLVIESQMAQIDKLKGELNSADAHLTDEVNRQVASARTPLEQDLKAAQVTISQLQQQIDSLSSRSEFERSMHQNLDQVASRINELEQLAASQQAQLQSLRAALVELTLSNANPKSHAIHLVRGS